MSYEYWEAMTALTANFISHFILLQINPKKQFLYLEVTLHKSSQGNFREMIWLIWKRNVLQMLWVKRNFFINLEMRFLSLNHYPCFVPSKFTAFESKKYLCQGIQEWIKKTFFKSVFPFLHTLTHLQPSKLVHFVDNTSRNVLRFKSKSKTCYTLYLIWQFCFNYHCLKDALTAQKMKFSIKNFFSKCDQIRRFCHIYWRNP